MTNRYQYRAIASHGQKVSGQYDAPDVRSALAGLAKEGFTVLDIVTQPAQSVAVHGRGVSAQDRVVLLREVSTLQGAGVPLAEALDSLAQAYAETPLGPVIARVRQDVASGQSLTEAFRQGGMHLPDYVLALIEAGEASGKLAPAFSAAADHLEYEQRMLAEIRQALIYPAILVLAGIAAVLLVFIGVVPRFGPLITGNRAAQIPEISRWVIGAGIFLKQHLGLFSLAGAALLAIVGSLLLQARVRLMLLGRLLDLPVIGAWLRQAEIGRWARLCGTLLDNRVPLVRALELSLPALRLPVMRRQLADAPAQLGRGETLASVLQRSGWLPPQRLNLIRVGERSGDLARMLRSLGDIQAEAARNRMRQLLALLEPVAILGIGSVIGGVMIAIILAITGINTMS